MSQEDILNILEASPGCWLSMNDIKEALKKAGKSNGVLTGVSNDVYKLAAFKFIDVKGDGLWQHTKLFKIKQFVDK